MNYDALAAEIAKPAYKGKSNDGVLAMLNAKTLTDPKPALITAMEFYAVVDAGEYAAVRAASPDIFLLMANSQGRVDVSPGAPMRTMIDAAFAPYAATKAKWEALLATFDEATKPWAPTALDIPPGTILTQPDLDRVSDPEVAAGIAEEDARREQADQAAADLRELKRQAAETLAKADEAE